MNVLRLVKIFMKRTTKNLFEDFSKLMLFYEETLDESVLLIIEEYQNTIIKLLSYDKNL